MIPEFSPNGELPPGVHETDLDEIEQTLGFNDHRQVMIEGLRKAIKNLRAAGVKRVWVNDSFVTNEKFPNDIDGCWDPQGVAIEKIDPVFLDFKEGRVGMQLKYFVDFFPNVVEWESGLLFYQFFQQNRDVQPKGILLLELGG